MEVREEKTEPAIRDRARWLDLLRSIGAIANRVEALDEALQKALREVCKHNGWFAGFSRVRGYPREIIWAEPAGKGVARLDPEIRLLARRWALQAMAAGQTLYVDDLSANEEGILELPAGLDQIGGAASTPLAAGGRIAGAMVFFCRHALSAPLGQGRVGELAEVLESVGTLMGSAVERWHLVRRITEEAEREREAVGREIHDGLAQQLVGVRMLAQNLRRRSGELDSDSARQWQQLLDQLSQAQRQARSLAYGLSSPELAADGETLVEHLQAMAAMVEGGYEVNCRLEVTGRARLEDGLARGQLVRIAREAVLNALRHAQPKTIELVLRQEAKQLVLEIRDDGSGLPEKQDPFDGMGISGMRYRASLMGAQLKLESQRGAGTVVRCVLPEVSSSVAAHDDEDQARPGPGEGATTSAP